MEKGKKTKEKPKYNMVQNLGFLVKKAWNLEKRIVLLPIVLEVARLLRQLVELFVAPMILSALETETEVFGLLLTIGVFTILLAVLAGTSEFVEQQASQGEGRLRQYLWQELEYRTCVTSYENTMDKKWREKRTQANEEINHRKAVARLWDDFVNLCVALVGFGLYLLLLSRVSFVLIAVAVITAGISYVLNRRVTRWDFEHREETADYEHHMRYVSNTILANEMGKDIRIFGLTDWLRSIYDAALRLYTAFLTKKQRKYLAVSLVDLLFTVLRNGLAYLYLLQIVLRDGLPASEFLLMFGAVGGFTAWVTRILEKLALLHKRSVGLCKAREFFDWEEPFLFEEGETLVCKKGAKYELRMEDVTYRYPEAEKATLEHINLTIQPGEKLAVVGLNGAGKTTLVKLLCGFLNPTEGRVLLNGVDIRTYNRREYYRLFSAVFQEFSYLGTTIAANVAQSDDDIDRTRVEECLKKAGLGKVIAELPKGMDTYYSKDIFDDGIELSGGQVQRLMLARALYKQAPVLVLDEPTAALDPLAESEIYQKYNEMSEGRSSIFISHRLASTRFCDRILFLSDGGITEEGTHEELIEKNQGYAKLFEVQSRYYRENTEWEGGLSWQE